MGIYEAARNRTMVSIQESFWELYTSEEKKRVTVEDVCRNTGITRSTFYYYYNYIHEVLDSIKQKQMDLISDLFETSNNENRDFQSFIPRFQELFIENERYLIPLVMEYKDPEFSLRYRSYIEDMLFNDLQIDIEEPSTQTTETLSVIISGLVHMFLNCLASNIITLEDANNMSNGMINTGLRWVLKEKYGVDIGFKRMVN
ncbi:MAG: TetR/AcrR family transcriptional regulator [Candidatus Methanomethylophilaceae archaeon]|nr:TetR/AcrR family transcriptional regulator [Candidatus Methanomethylophilaceae archaeon]